jgi:DNA-directed RNA polymerase specialized sigma24 family protein
VAKAAKLQPHRGTLKAFLTAVVRNRAVDVVRREQVIRAKESLAAETTRWLETAMPTDPSEGEDGITIRTALNRLPRLKKEALFLGLLGLPWIVLRDSRDDGLASARIG